MGITRYADGSYFHPIRSGQACPVCGSKKGRCSVFVNSEGEAIFYKCKYSPSDRVANDGWYMHLEKDVKTNSKVVYLPNVKEVPITLENLKLRDKVYRRFRELTKKYLGSYLLDEDMKNLTDRGLNEMQIIKMGFFSVPSISKEVYSDNGNFKIKMQTAISNALFDEFGGELLKVPGFIKRKGRNGSEYISFKSCFKEPKTDKFKTIRGYFIPYYNIDGLLVGLQYRLTEKVIDDKCKEIRYFWYSSSNSRSGSPMDFYIPSELKRQDILLVTEGAIKGKIASEKLGFQGVFEAGVANYNNLIKNIQLLEIKNNCKYHIILALDMDKTENPDVIRAENKTVSLLKGTGHQVALAEWNGKKAKGIDDAIIYNLPIKYKLV